jgi:hypothetical protein
LRRRDYRDGQGHRNGNQSHHQSRFHATPSNDG